MNAEQINRSSGAVIGFLIAVVLFVAIAVVAKFSIHTPAIDADRGAERSKVLAEIRATEYTNLTTVGWVDKQRGIVRLPIEDAMQLAVSDWQNPKAARSNLVQRAEHAAAPAPKVAPKPNAAE